MSAAVIRAEMRKDEEGSYIGSTVFSIEGHKTPYEITFFSKRGKEWDYSLSFAGESGDEEQFLLMDGRLEEDDELFDDLLDAAMAALKDDANGAVQE